MLTSEDFPSFFEAVYGLEPFPWQCSLVRHVLEHGAWPAVLDLPTGSGKTAVLDIAVFALAATAGSNEQSPRRIVFVVDRRVVVDQASERAKELARRLNTAGAGPDGRDDVVGKVRAALLRLAGGSRPTATHAAGAARMPLHVSVMRGGVPRDNTWTVRPDQPTIVLSTVDQVGSRLLFRGYGVSDSMKPVHAGLLGADTLFLLDEVHLSQPFADTLGQAERYMGHGGFGGQRRWQLVQMSATPRAAAEGRGSPPFTLGPEDRDEQQAEPLVRRLRAVKEARLVPLKGGSVGDAMASAVQRELRSLPGQAVGVVVNRVATARRIAAALPAESTVLLTGLMRPLDRQAVYARHQNRIAATRTDRSGADERLVVVATQTIEAGADLDFDALIAECAPIDSLRQRFGRLDRLGTLSAAGTPAQAVVLAPKQSVEGSDPDPVYGGSIRAAYEWLKGRHGDRRFDVGPESGDLAGAPMEAHSPRRAGPRLLPHHLDLLVQTWPRPSIDPQIAPWLHGFDTGPGDVTVVWRADLTEEILEEQSQAQSAAATSAGGSTRRTRRRGSDPDRELVATQRVAMCPPSVVEGMQVPLHAVLAWLRAAEEVDVADVEGVAEAGSPATNAMRYALVWRGADDNHVIGGAGESGGRARRGDTVSTLLRPGDTVVVPASYGGMSRLNWDPSATDPVADLGDWAQLTHRRSATLRLHPTLVSANNAPMLPGLDPDQEEEDVRALVELWLEQVKSNASLAPWMRVAAWVLLERGWSRMRRHWIESPGAGPGAGYLVLTAPVPPLPPGAFEDGMGEVFRRVGLEADATLADIDDLDGSDLVNAFTATGVPVSLQSHLDNVGDLAALFAARCGLPDVVVDDLRLAGRLHDLGKADRRFQRWLHDGDELSMLSQGELLAKSIHADSRDAAARERARRQSGYPRGTRHEVLSVALVGEAEEVKRRAHDWDLVLHLVASHHGYCRPLAPVVVDSSSEDVEVEWDGVPLKTNLVHGLERMDSGITHRFWRLVDRYGWWGLAWLEAILRLADHRQSQLEQEGRHA
jgi:CRISPR-associated endonuclease/helicase Cas3